MTPSPDSIDLVLGMIAERRDVLTNLETALLDVRRVFGQPFVVPLPQVGETPRPALPAPVTPAPARRVKANVAPPPPTFGPKPRAKREDIGPRVLSFLSDQAAPVRFAQIAAGIGVANKAYVRGALNALVDAGKVVRRGVKAGQTIGLPRVMAAAGKGPAISPAPREVKPTAPAPVPTPDVNRLRVAIWKVLKSGASVDPREVLRAIRSDAPAATVDEVTTELEALVAGARVERIIISPTTKRYRALFPGRATA